MPTVRILARSGYSPPHLDAPARPAVIDGRNRADLAEVSAADRLTTGDAARREPACAMGRRLEHARSSFGIKETDTAGKGRTAGAVTGQRLLPETAEWLDT